MSLLLRHAVWTLPLLSAASLVDSSSTTPLQVASSQEEEPAPDEPRWTQEKLEAVTREIQAQIEELRDAKFAKPVKVALTDQAGLIEYAKERSAATSTPEEIHASELMSKMLGLIEADADLFQASLDMIEGQAGGFYDPGTETFYLMERFAMGGAAKIVLAHELTHALDDQLHDLDAPLHSTGMSTDEQLAYHAIVEGSGMAAMQQWMMSHPQEWGVADIEASQTMTQDSMVGVPQVVWKPLLASYLAGDAFLRRSSALINVFGTHAKKEDVVSAFGSPPLSTEQVLHPAKYWEEEAKDAPVAISFQVAELREGWTVTHRDTLGELMLSLVTTPLDQRGDLDMTDPQVLMGLSFTNDSAAGWGGDRFILLESEKAAILRGVTAWDTGEDADEFVRALQAVELHLEKSLFALDAYLHGEGESNSRFRIERKSGTVVELTASVGLDAEALGRVLDAVQSSMR